MPATLIRPVSDGSLLGLHRRRFFDVTVVLESRDVFLFGCIRGRSLGAVFVLLFDLGEVSFGMSSHVMSSVPLDVSVYPSVMIRC